jgi:hypothetical protein
MMVQILRLLTSLTLLILVTGCATPTVLTPDAQKGLSRVGVLTLLPNEMVYKKIGTTVFNNEVEKESVGVLFNQAAFNEVASRVSTGDRVVIKLDADTNALARQIRSGAIVWNSPAERIEGEIRRLVSAHSLDAVILVIENYDSDNGIAGIDFFMRTAFGLNDQPVVRAGIATILVDKNAKSIAQRYRGLSMIVRNQNQAQWSYSLRTDLDPKTKQHIQERASDAITQTVRMQLSAMGL